MEFDRLKATVEAILFTTGQAESVKDMSKALDTSEEEVKEAVKKIDPVYVSAVIQINTDTKAWVSDSPYLHSFDRLDEVHHQMEEQSLSECLKEAGYSFRSSEREDLPNGKALLRLDYIKDSI